MKRVIRNSASKDDVSATFSRLSVKDLVEARDLYHHHLVNKANVVGTAIGLFLIRNSEAGKKSLEPRTLENSSVQEKSWPCVLVFVDKWADPADFGWQKPYTSQDMVPTALYMPDGRVVPVCVVKVDPAETPASSGIWRWQKGILGGGSPVRVTVQNQEHVATAGCLVSDGHTVYALTNRHVAGKEGTPIFSRTGGESSAIGWSSEKQLTRLPFETVYPGFPGKQVYSTMDVGLVEVADVNEWSSEMIGLGPVGPISDLSETNLTLRVIGAEVVASGARSGVIKGRISALFYRYKALGGYEYVSDFLIAPSAGQGTLPGDSGAVWNLVQEGELPGPLAVEWGGQVFDGASDARQFNFALATSLANVCRLLDVELVRDHNTGAAPYWGKRGHYTIATFACEAVKGKLGRIMAANEDQISFSLGELGPKSMDPAMKAASASTGLIPLADVPDLVWKHLPSKVPGGRDTRYSGPGASTGPEHPTHFADIDELNPIRKTTLREFSLEDPANNLTVSAWQTFFDECGHPSSKPTERGLLPFRVWQFYSAMVDALRRKAMDEFVCAAGLLAHYVGDACQPLHGSIYANGYKDQKDEDDSTSSNSGSGVHSAYETAMIDRYTDDRRTDNIVEGIQNEIANVAPIATITDGHTAALETVKLMDRAATLIPPKKIVDAFIAAGGKANVATYDALWKKFGRKTVHVMADGAVVLAAVWSGAWKQGGGESLAAGSLGAIPARDLIKLYTDPDFVPSRNLDHVEEF
ncbi:MAG TPA: hypothetical protein VNB29_11525, partial [Chthoniobacterales bacterium]|nr:hypothetical protein [Chthoniobacterales bacterium]